MNILSEQGCTGRSVFVASLLLGLLEELLQMMSKVPVTSSFCSDGVVHVDVLVERDDPPLLDVLETHL